MKEITDKLEHNFQLICERLLDIPYEERSKMPFQGFKNKEEREEFVAYAKLRSEIIIKNMREYLDELSFKWGDKAEEHIDPKIKEYLEEGERLARKAGLI